MAGQVTPSPPKTGSFVESDETGGAIKPSAILGAIGSGSAGLAALAPITAPITIPLGIIAGIGSTIAGLFGGRLTSMEMDMLAQIKGRVDQRNKMGIK